MAQPALETDCTSNTICDNSVGRSTSHRAKRVIGWLFLLPLSAVIIGLMRFKTRYRIANHRRIREEFLKITRSPEPLMVCANHLTLIDSVILIWALASTWTYARNYRLFCWNLPAAENARKRWSFRFVTFLMKCLLIDRLGDAEHTGSVLESISSLLRQGDLVMIFPEGTRSRSGVVDLSAVNYGIGKILEEIPNCRVLCIYQRGRSQKTYSDFPKRGEIFDIRLELFQPTSKFTGLRAARDRSQQVIHKIKQMEESHMRRFSIAHGRE